MAIPDLSLGPSMLSVDGGGGRIVSTVRSVLSKPGNSRPDKHVLLGWESPPCLTSERVFGTLCFAVKTEGKMPRAGEKRLVDSRSGHRIFPF